MKNHRFSWENPLSMALTPYIPWVNVGYPWLLIVKKYSSKLRSVVDLMSIETLYGFIPHCTMVYDPGLRLLSARLRALGDAGLDGGVLDLAVLDTCQPRVNHHQKNGKNMGKTWEKIGKIMGKSYENHQKLENHGKSTVFIIASLNHCGSFFIRNYVFFTEIVGDSGSNVPTLRAIKIVTPMF